MSHQAPELRAQTQQSNDPFQARFGGDHRLPLDMRAEAAGMSWSLFSATYAPASNFRISELNWEPVRGGQFLYRAKMTRLHKASAPETTHHEVVASGPVSACSRLLADAGRHVEILSFRQVDLFQSAATFVRAAHQLHPDRNTWAMGFGATRETSTASALTSAAYLIYG